MNLKKKPKCFIIWNEGSNLYMTLYMYDMNGLNFIFQEKLRLMKHHSQQIFISQARTSKTF
jgi:hypothetical protein